MNVTVFVYVIDYLEDWNIVYCNSCIFKTTNALLTVKMKQFIHWFNVFFKTIESSFMKEKYSYSSVLKLFNERIMHVTNPLNVMNELTKLIKMWKSYNKYMKREKRLDFLKDLYDF